MEFKSNVVPALRNIKDFEKMLESEHEFLVFLETRISQLRSLVKYAHKQKKKVFIHADLVQGLKADEYGIEFLINEVKVDGIISTRGNVITLAKKHRIFAVQRLFVLDSHALEHNLKICNRVKPDCIEVLPGIIPKIIQEVHEQTGIPIIAGGLIRTNQDIEEALGNGAVAVTTSNRDLWD
ncbi:glycerol-3-phosphate responsive antiterminator [Salinibacillus kushneri]|uniref:glycerol-3-phosphate responsive antiterminator n=1 Tax=Salinibacillus kushneri TaxID=237682 RepID=UPI000B84EFF1|nr:glycerol-3-phosphate responsive antiterminator [Salinibacillus kushneri]